MMKFDQDFMLHLYSVDINYHVDSIVDAAVGLLPETIQLEHRQITVANFAYKLPMDIHDTFEGIIGDAWKASTIEERRHYLQILEVASWAVFHVLDQKIRSLSDKQRTIQLNSLNKEMIRQLFLDKMLDGTDEIRGLGEKLILERDREKVLINAWIGYHQSDRKSSDDDPLFWACEELLTAVKETPEKAIDLISKICEKVENELILANLGAGLVEDLLVYHGKQVVNQLAVRARQDPKFSRMLSNVWGDGIDREVWEKIRPFLKSNQNT